MQVQENDYKWGRGEVKRIFLWRGGGAGYKDRPGQTAKRLCKEVTFRIGLEEGQGAGSRQKAAGGFRERLKRGGRRAPKGVDIKGQSPPDCRVRAWLSILKASELPLHHRFLAHPWVSGSGTEHHLPFLESLSGTTLGSKRGEGGDRGQDGWMASSTPWTWANSRWRTGKPGVLQSMGSQRAGHDWVTEQQPQNLKLGNHITIKYQLFIHLFNQQVVVDHLPCARDRAGCWLVGMHFVLRTPRHECPPPHTHIHSHLSLSSLNNSSPSVNSFKNIPIIFQRAAQSVIRNKEKESVKNLKIRWKPSTPEDQIKNKYFSSYQSIV